MTDALRHGEDEVQVVSTYLKPLVRSLPTGVLMLNVDRTVLIANEALVSLVGLRAAADDLVGMRDRDLVPLRTRPADHYRKLDAFFRGCLEHRTVRHGAKLPLGPHQTVDAEFVPIGTGTSGRNGLLWVLRTVTDREARGALERRTDELSRLAALKTEFLATLSHELRTPLTAMTGLAELLIEDSAVADAMQRNVRRMTNLVETLLLLAGVESRSLPLTISRVDPADLLRHQISTTMATDRARSVRLRLLPDPAQPSTIDGDEKLLGELIHHALASAIHDTGPGTTVNVLPTTNSPAGTWTVKITSPPGNGGSAIGSGLDIALARAISERHGGKMILERTENGDHTIRIELPLTRS